MISLYVLRAIKELGIPLKKKICLIVGSCEEGIWTDMEHFKEQFPAPDHGFTPDGAFPIYNVEKGYADICLTFSEPEGLPDHQGCWPVTAGIRYRPEP